MARVCALALVIAVVAGCGAGKPATDAAMLVPADASAYATLRPRHDDATRVASLRALAPPWLARVFPGAGPKVDVAQIPVGKVALTQPPDEKAFAKHLDAHGLLHERLSGWTLVARTAAVLDAVRHRHASLTETRWFPAARRAVGVVDGPTVFLKRGGVRWRAETASVHGSVLVDHVYTGGLPAPATAPSSLAGAAPDDALYVLEAADTAAAATLPGVLGLDVRGLLAAIGAPLVLWLEPGAPIPTATIVARPANLRAHARAVGRFLVRQGEGRNAPQRSGALESVDLGPITVYWGIVGGALVVSDTADAPGKPGTKLRDLLDEANVPPRVTRLTYIDDERAVPVFQAFAALANEALPAGFVTSAATVASELRWTGRSGAVTTAALYRRAR